MIYFFDCARQNRGKVEKFTREWTNKTHTSYPNLYPIDESSYPPVSHQLFISGIPANTKSQDLKQFFK